MGHIDLNKGALPVRAGYLEVRALDGSENIIEQPLTGFNVSRPDFEPMEFLVVVSSSGLVGEPILTKSSGWEEVDAFFRGYLAKSYHVGERLPPGRYVVVVGA
jgi:hypothetical protein